MRASGDPAEDPADLDSLRSMYEAAYPRLLALVRCRSAPALAARRDAEDILQTAFLSGRERWSDFRQSGMAFYPWFCRIVLDRLCDDHDYHATKKRNYRAERAWPDRSSMQFALGMVNPITSPSESAIRQELKARIDRVLARLSPEHQEIMVLIHFAELTKEQAAELLEIKAGTVRQQYARARAKFRVIWKECYGQEQLG